MRWWPLGMACWLLLGCGMGASRYERHETSLWRAGHDLAACGGDGTYYDNVVDRCMQAKGYRIVE